ARDEDPLPVPTTEVPVGRQRRVGGSQGARDGAREQVALRLEVQEADRRLEQRAVHALADPALVAVEERVHDAEGAEDPRGEVEEGHAATDGSAARLARDGHDAAERLHERLVARALGGRAGPAEGRDRAVDQARIFGREALPAEAELLHGPGAEVLDEDVGAAGQPPDDLDALRRLEIHRDPALVAVVDEIARGLPVLVWGPGARLVADVRILHLDDVGAHVAEERAAEGPGQDAGEIHDADAIEREGGHGHVRYYNAMSALRDALTRRILVLAGAMGTMLQAAGLTAADFGGPHS